MVATTQEIIVYRDIATLRLWERNYREGDVGAIVVSIERFGFNGALRVWQDGIVAAGNHALKALQSMKAGGYALPRGIHDVAGQWHAPCVDVSHLSKVEAEAFAVADNHTQELGLNDEQQLTELLQGIAAQDVDLLAATGYGADDLDAMLAAMGEPVADPGAQVDRADELQQVWQVALGDVWQIGDHRLLCGDSTNADDVARVMAGERADAVVTDPPYGQNQDGVFNDDPAGLGELYSSVISNFPVQDAIAIAFQSMRLFPFWLDSLRNADHHFERALVYYDTGGWSTSPWRGWMPHSQLILVSSLGNPTWPENVTHVRDVYSINNQFHGDDKLTSSHPTMKHVDTVASLIEHTAGLVYDPFLGSGTTLVACEQTLRRGRGIEIEPKYCAVTLQRLADMGLEPARVSE